MLLAIFDSNASYSGFHGVALFLLVAGIILAVLWLLVLAERYVATMPKMPRADPATNDLRDEPPAVVNLLVNRWRPTRIAMAATLIDLVARKIFDIQQLDRDHFVVHIERVPDDRAALAPYERQMLEWVESRATGGSAPVEALTLGNEAEAEAWWKRFSSAVAKDTSRLGLARGRWAGQDWGVLGFILALALGAIGLSLAAAHVGGGSSGGDDDLNPLDWLIVAFVAWGAIMGWLRSLRSLRDTPAGQEACAHWLGVRDYLQSTHAFDELPPAAVVLWERYLSYGAALGAAHDAVHALPFAVDEPGTAWTRYTGTWRQVRIEYPTRFGFGQSPVSVFFGGLVRVLFWGALAFIALPVVTRIVYDVVTDALTSEQRSNAELYLLLGLTLFVAIAGTYLVVRFLAGVIRLVRGVRDIGQSVTVEGPVVKVYQGRYAVDDGKSDELVAWFKPADSPALERGMTVRATMSPHLHHVTQVSVLSGAAPGAGTSASDAGATNGAAPLLAVDAAAVREVTGFDLPPVTDAEHGTDAFLGKGATTAAFSDKKNTVACARGPSTGPAAALLSNVSRLPGGIAQQVETPGGPAWWIGGRALVRPGGAVTDAVVVDLPGVDATRRQAMATELLARMSGVSTAAPPPPASV